MSEAIDFSTYAPGTVLCVRCRDKLLGYVHLNLGDADDRYPNLLVRDDFVWEWITAEGFYLQDGISDYDVTEIIGEMVLRIDE